MKSMSSLSTTMDSYGRAYPQLVQLHILSEIESGFIFLSHAHRSASTSSGSDPQSSYKIARHSSNPNPINGSSARKSRKRSSSGGERERDNDIDASHLSPSRPHASCDMAINANATLDLFIDQQSSSTLPLTSKSNLLSTLNWDARSLSYPKLFLLTFLSSLISLIFLTSLSPLSLLSFRLDMPSTSLRSRNFVLAVRRSILAIGGNNTSKQLT